MNKIVYTVLVSVLCLVSGCGNTRKELLFTRGEGVVSFRTGNAFGDREVKLYYYIPGGDIGKMPLQIIMHGAGRNADEYLLSMKEKADRYKMMLLAPEFPKKVFPNRDYQEGGILDPDGKRAPDEKTAYAVIDSIFEYVLEHSDLTCKTYNIFGHSAGGQFVHRFLLFHDSPYVAKAVAANAGWYTYPDTEINYPYGVKGMCPDARELKKRYYSKDLTILLGTADTIRDKDFRVTPEAELQGYTRLDRGRAFYAVNQAEASEAGLTFNWKIGYVQDSGHDFRKMSPAGADLLYMHP